MIARPTIFTALNAHTFGCGLPPELPDGNYYRGYFENLYGEQWIFTYDRAADEVDVRGGDVGWATALTVESFEEFYQNLDSDHVEVARSLNGEWLLLGEDGPVTLNKPEQAWLALCMSIVEQLRAMQELSR